MFGVITVLLQVFVPHSKLAHVLKWLTLTSFAYVATVISTFVAGWVDGKAPAGTFLLGGPGPSAPAARFPYCSLSCPA